MSENNPEKAEPPSTEREIESFEDTKIGPGSILKDKSDSYLEFGEVNYPDDDKTPPYIDVTRIKTKGEGKEKGKLLLDKIVEYMQKHPEIEVDNTKREQRLKEQQLAEQRRELMGDVFKQEQKPKKELTREELVELRKQLMAGVFGTEKQSSKKPSSEVAVLKKEEQESRQSNYTDKTIEEAEAMINALKKEGKYDSANFLGKSIREYQKAIERTRNMPKITEQNLPKGIDKKYLEEIEKKIEKKGLEAFRRSLESAIKNVKNNFGLKS